jgi:hypothetical protein
MVCLRNISVDTLHEGDTEIIVIIIIIRRRRNLVIDNDNKKFSDAH